MEHTGECRLQLCLPRDLHQVDADAVAYDLRKGVMPTTPSARSVVGSDAVLDAVPM